MMDSDDALCGADGVIITDDLGQRPSRAPDFDAENQALISLTDAMTVSPDGVLQRLIETAMTLTRADSAGISLLEPGGETGIFRWIVTAGAWAPYRDGKMPREVSPCGEVIARDTVLLVTKPERAFPALMQASPAIVEGLLAPFDIDGKPGGTVWVVKHDDAGKFDAEDARLLARLARFASAAHQMLRALDTATAARRGTEQHLQLALDAAAMGTFVWYPEGDRGEPDDRMLALFGLPPGGTLNLKVVLETMIHPDDRQRYADAAARAVEPDGDGRLMEDIRLCLPDGSLRWVAISAQTYFEGTPPQPTRMIGTAADISEGKNADARRTLLLELGDSLRAIADPGEVQVAAMRVLVDHLGLKHAQYFESGDDDHYLTQTGGHSAGSLSSGERVRLDLFGAYAKEGHPAGRSLYVNDVRQDDRITRAQVDAHIAAKVGAYVDVPFFRDGRCLGGVRACHAAPHIWSDAEVGLIEDVAERTRAAVERAEAQCALRQREAHYRALATTGTFSIYRMSADWQVMYELDSDTLADTAHPIDSWLRKYIPEPDLPIVMAAIEYAIATKSLFELEHRVRFADGSIGWVASRAVPLLGSDGEIMEWFGMGTDVTERRFITERLRETDNDHRVELERQVRQRTAELQTSRDLLEATMNASTDMIQVFDAVRDASGEIVDFTWVLNDHAAEARYGNVLGESLIDRSPGVITEGIFDTFKQVTETGISRQNERHYVHEQFDGWFLQTVVKLNDGVATTTKDISDWKRAQHELLRMRDEAAEAELRESEDRLRQYGDASQDILWMRDAETLQWQYLTPAFEAIYGLDREEALTGDNFQSWLDLILPEDREDVIGNIERVREGEKVTFEFRLRHPVDGEIRWLRETDFPMTDGAGRVVRIGGIGHDVTELKTTEEALAAAERRQRALLDGIPQLVWRAVDGGEWTWASPQWTEYTGQFEADSHGQGWLDPVHPDDRDAARRAWASAIESGGFEVDYRICHAEAGEYRWFTTRATPVRAADGTIIEWLGTSTEVHELRAMQERQHILVGELQHRTRNLIAVVRSMSDKTMLRANGLPDFRDKFRDRLEALARVQGLLSRLDEHDRVTFDELIRADLNAMGVLDGDAERVTLTGPDNVRLRSSTVQTLAMAMHELATNAAKYGALRQPDGRLNISWDVEVPSKDGDPWLHIDWHESGVAMPEQGSAPTGSGQGRELIERALPYQLKAKTRYELGPDGVRCRISLPVSAQGRNHANGEV